MEEQREMFGLEEVVEEEQHVAAHAPHSPEYADRKHGYGSCGRCRNCKCHTKKERQAA